MSLVQKAFDGVSQAFFKEDQSYFREMIGKADKDKIALYLEKFPHAAQWTYSQHNYTTIHECAMARRYDLIPLFQQYGVDINQPTLGGEPPVRWTHNKEQIAQMVAMGATMDDPRWKGLTPLMYNAQFAWADEIEGLLAHGADPHKVFHGPGHEYHGKTALQLASRFTDDMGPDDGTPNRQQARTVELLLAAGGHSVEELTLCRQLAGKWAESAPAALLLQAALEKAVVEQAADEKKAIDNIVHGLPESTSVRRPLTLKKTGQPCH
ncbi:MAG: hypothetical protein ACAH80_11570 [Alphaproteobacteria bacterium]